MQEGEVVEEDGNYRRRKKKLGQNHPKIFQLLREGKIPRLIVGLSAEARQKLTLHNQKFRTSWKYGVTCSRGLSGRFLRERTRIDELSHQNIAAIIIIVFVICRDANICGKQDLLSKNSKWNELPKEKKKKGETKCCCNW